jgi:hypothetical protein
MAPAAPGWLDALGAASCAWRTLRTREGTELEAWVCEVAFPPYLGARPDSLSGDCRKRGGLIAAADGSMSCAEVEVVKLLRAAGFLDADVRLGDLAAVPAIAGPDPR